MHIGLIGGIGPAATGVCYRRLFREMATRGTWMCMARFWLIWHLVAGRWRH